MFSAGKNNIVPSSIVRMLVFKGFNLKTDFLQCCYRVQLKIGKDKNLRITVYAVVDRWKTVALITNFTRDLLKGTVKI